jgi:hypothetical protein
MVEEEFTLLEPAYEQAVGNDGNGILHQVLTDDDVFVFLRHRNSAKRNLEPAGSGTKSISQRNRQPE